LRCEGRSFVAHGPTLYLPEKEVKNYLAFLPEQVYSLVSNKKPRLSAN
jgi:hypothetical protein